MLRIKKLDLFLLQTFLPVFVMTTFICLFILIMQFLWMYIDDMVGKGIEMDVLAKLFFYAAVTFIPMSLPLALLLASLITFGNLGERLELLSMKAAGISLLRIMRPLVVLVVFITVLDFYFQNNILPVANVKFHTLLFSMKQKSPELDIPEGVFYDQINGYNLYVKKKNRETGVLYDMMIYDITRGFDNTNIIVADSGKLNWTEDKRYLFLTLYDGVSFQNNSDRNSKRDNVPYRRETFSLKEILIPFDQNFNMIDESFAQDRYTAKNLSELNTSVDSIYQLIDSIGTEHVKDLKKEKYFKISYLSDRTRKDTILHSSERELNLDSIYAALDLQRTQSVVDQAWKRAQEIRDNYDFKNGSIREQEWFVRRHIIEIHKKFTLSFACLVFFFIAAPLGAIIRKGGLGMPAVISVFFFIFYYIINNIGIKMARDGVWVIWVGVWFSSFILLPIGVFLTYKAVKDSVVFNSDTYLHLMRRLFGQRVARNIQMKEVISGDVNNEESLPEIDRLTTECRDFMNRISGTRKRQGFLQYWTEGCSFEEIDRISVQLENMIDYVSNSDKPRVILKLAEYPSLQKLFFLRPVTKRWVGTIIACFLPISLPGYLLGVSLQNRLKQTLQHIVRLNEELKIVLVAPKEEKVHFMEEDA